LIKAKLVGSVNINIHGIIPLSSEIVYHAMR